MITHYLRFRRNLMITSKRLVAIPIYPENINFSSWPLNSTTEWRNCYLKNSSRFTKSREMCNSLFSIALRTLIKEAPNDVKLSLLQTVIDEVGSVTQPVTIIDLYYSRFLIPSDLMMEILQRLDPIWEKRGWNDDRWIRTHPYVIQIVNEIGNEAFEGDIDINRYNLPLHSNYEIDSDGGYHIVRIYIPNNPSDNRFRSHPVSDEPLKSEEEVSKVIQEVLRKEEIIIDRDKLKEWLKERTKYH